MNPLLAPEGGREMPVSRAKPKPRARRGEGRGRFQPRRRACPFCADKTSVIDYKDPGKLRRFISDRGKIEPRRRSGACARHQRALALAIKRARHLAMLPFTSEHIRRSGGASPRE